MYLFIVFCKDLLCVSFPFWLKDFHLCVYIFCFPPSLTVFSFLYRCFINRLISMFHPVFTTVASRDAPISGLWALGYLHCFALQCVVTFMSLSAFPPNLRQCTIVHHWCHPTRMGCWCHLVKWFDWSMVESNLVQQWDKPSSRWKGSAFWDQKRDKVKREDRKRWLFLRFVLFVCGLVCGIYILPR